MYLCDHAGVGCWRGCWPLLHSVCTPQPLCSARAPLCTHAHRRSLLEICGVGCGLWFIVTSQNLNHTCIHRHTHVSYVEVASSITSKQIHELLGCLLYILELVIFFVHPILGILSEDETFVLDNECVAGKSVTR